MSVAELRVVIPEMAELKTRIEALEAASSPIDYAIMVQRIKELEAGLADLRAKALELENA